MSEQGDMNYPALYSGSKSKRTRAQDSEANRPELNPHETDNLQIQDSEPANETRVVAAKGRWVKK